MLHSWCNDTVVRVRPGTKESRGSIIFDWSNPDTLTISGCSMQPSGTSLTQDGRVLGITDGYTCYCPPEADVKAGDRIRFDGNDYTIQGEPRLSKSPTGRVSSIMLNLLRGEN